MTNRSSPEPRSAIEEGVVNLDTPACPPGSTIRHLLAHTSGL
jgi:CubicO group peptidase (beta-lactamase class C family)